MAKGKMPAGLKAYLAKKGKGKSAEVPGESEKMPMAMMPAASRKATGKSRSKGKKK